MVLVIIGDAPTGEWLMMMLPIRRRWMVYRRADSSNDDATEMIVATMQDMKRKNAGSGRALK